MGEVKAAPTANTLLARMKTLTDNMATLLASGLTLATGASVLDGGPATVSTVQHTSSADMTGGADLTAAPGAGLKIVLDGICVTSAVAMALSLLEETSGTVIGILNIGAGGGVQFNFRDFGGIKLPTAVKKLRGDADGAGQVDVFCFYHTEA